MQGRDFTDAGRAFHLQWYEDKKSTCEDRFRKTRHKMCHHHLVNGWAWKDDEKVRWKYQPGCEDPCT